jgi:hypothetical protein
LLHLPQHPFFFFIVAARFYSFRLKLSPLSKSIPEAKLGRTKFLKAPLEINFLCIILAAFSNNFEIKWKIPVRCWFPALRLFLCKNIHRFLSIIDLLFRYLLYGWLTGQVLSQSGKTSPTNGHFIALPWPKSSKSRYCPHCRWQSKGRLLRCPCKKILRWL